jgi:hypothetical protein
VFPELMDLHSLSLASLPSSFEVTNMNTENLSPWGADWAWGLPLIVLTVMFHVVGLRFIKRCVDRRIQYVAKHQTLSLGVVTLCTTLLHVVEVAIWAFMFLFLGAVTDRPTAVLYSLNALTAFGHTDVELQRKWQLMGAIESLNGWILFGLSAAYLFFLIQLIWSRDTTTARTEFY